MEFIIQLIAILAAVWMGRLLFARVLFSALKRRLFRRWVVLSEDEKRRFLMALHQDEERPLLDIEHEFRSKNRSELDLEFKREVSRAWAYFKLSGLSTRPEIEDSWDAAYGHAVNGIPKDSSP